MSRAFFYSFTLFYLVALYYLATTLPIGPAEARDYYTNKEVLGQLMHLCDGWFSNTLDFRLPFLLFGVLNLLLFLVMSHFYLKEQELSYLATTIFALLPGIIASAVIANIAVVVISLVLGFIIAYHKKWIVVQYLLMVLLLFIHDASVIFFIAVAIYAAFRRDMKLFYVTIFLAAMALFYFNGLDLGGKPKGRFLELFGLYAALFSPFIFFYFFFALYRIWIQEKKDLLWYIAFSSFIISILLSIRQQVIMTDFAPYVIVAVVLMIVVYNRILNIRLPMFQRGYRLGYKIVLTSLILSSLIVIFHKAFFYFMPDKSKHFAYSFYYPYWITLELAEIGQNCYTTKNQKMQYQLKYYGVNSCNESDVSKIHR